MDKPYSTVWSVDFTDDWAKERIAEWITSGSVTHDASHVRALPALAPTAEVELGKAIAEQLRTEKAIIGVFDEGCMGMYNAIIDDELLNPLGIYKERLSQSALFAEMRTPLLLRSARACCSIFHHRADLGTVRSVDPASTGRSPVGCHRPRIPDRVIFDKLVQVLVLGAAYEKIADAGCSATTIRRRRDEWISAGVFTELEQLCLTGYDTTIGLELDTRGRLHREGALRR